MSLFKGFKTNAALSRLQEERLYAFILDEIETGTIRRGLMAKALANSGGNEQKAQSDYIKLRLQSIIDENTVSEAIASININQPPKNKKVSSLDTHKERVKRQEEFSLKETRKGNKGNFWSSLRSEFNDARKDD
jgi:hypothetical protein